MPATPPACPPALSRYRLIYVKCAKTAGTTLLSYFSACGFPASKDRCLRMAALSNATAVRHLLDVWPDYFVFGFSRNVLLRAVSQHRYLSTFTKPGCPLVPWERFCRDPYAPGDYCEATPRCCAATAEHHYLHASPQANCITTADGGTALDWLGRMERLEDDFRRLLAILNNRSGVPRLPTELTPRFKARASACSPRCRRGLAWEGGQGAEDTCDRMALFSGRHTQCYDSITQFFAEDIQLLH